jgi:hypothetical protein
MKQTNEVQGSSPMGQNPEFPAYYTVFDAVGAYVGRFPCYVSARRAAPAFIPGCMSHRVAQAYMAMRTVIATMPEGSPERTVLEASRDHLRAALEVDPYHAARFLPDGSFDFGF